MSLGVYLAIVGAAVCAAAAAGAAWSLQALRGTGAGASLSSACLVLAVTGVATAVSGAVMATGGLR